MCRIAGIVDLEGSMQIPVLKDSLLMAINSLSHGGPDDSGIFVDEKNHVILGHRRLSIIDLSPMGHQPMSNQDESLWISYNGEIYNFKEIRIELESLGYGFKSSSDTEVILNAYREWGEESFKRLNGMYAFSIYDRKNSLLYVVRDHAGIKPLYYSKTNDKITFASEVRAFRALNNEWEENPDWKVLFLIFGHIPEPYTTLKNVYMLPKGSFIKFDIKHNRQTIKEYTKLNLFDKIKDSNDAKQGLKNIFTRAVKRHLISDAPIGVFLSGGVDSSLVALVASQFLGENLRTISVVFNEKEYSEEGYQGIVVKKINSKHRSYLVTEGDFINSLNDIFSAVDQPSIDGINTYFISKCAKEEGLKAVLSGLGGDELFGGYSSFQRINKFWFLRNRNLKTFFNFFRHFNNERLKKLTFLSIDNPLKFYLLFRGLFPVDVVSQMLDIDIKAIECVLNKVYITDINNIGQNNFVTLIEGDLYMKNQLLKDTDYMSMWHSVETRVPFLDRELMEYVFSIKEAIKFNNDVPKGLLLDAFSDVLPSEIVNRKKMGFAFPFQKWMRNNLNVLSPYILEKKKKPVNKIIKDFEKDRLHWSRLWSLVILGKGWN